MMSVRAFSLADLAATIVVMTVLIAITMAGVSEHRRHARLGEDIAGLKRLGAATTAYAADNDDRLWGFTWKGGETYLMMDINGDLVPTQMPSDDVGAGARQAVHLIRAIGGRIGPDGMPIVNNWLPHTRYSHLTLFEYLGEDPLTRWATSAADEVKQNWKDDPINKFDEGFWLPLQPNPTPTNRRWPYTSGFEVGPASWDYNQSELGSEFDGMRTQQGNTHTTFVVPANVHVSDRLLSDVTAPGNKAHMYDTHQRHFGEKRHYFGAFESVEGEPALARVPVLMFDASAGVRDVRDCNPSWRANVPTFPCMVYWYQPSGWEPATTNGEVMQFSGGFMRWTRGGLKGVDFGAQPLDTGQATPGECSF